MQEHTSKDTEARGRATTPIRIVPASHAANPSADALREVHLSLVRAEQNLYNLVQASHASSPSAFGFATPTTFSSAGYAAPAFPPGFVPTNAVTPPAFGFATQPNGFGQAPAAASWPATSWNPLTTVTALPGAIAAGLSAISGMLAASVAALPGAGAVPAAFGAGYAVPAWAQSRMPACDISDEGKAFVCHLDLPGLRADQVELLCLEQAIIVSAIREADGEVVSLVQAERGVATQQRTVVLPAPIQPGAAKATLSNGILTVTLPKVNPTEGPRRIKVQG